MNKENEEEVFQGTPVSDEDSFFFNWAKESIKENVKLANDILKQLITLCTTLLGISIIFEKIVLHEQFRLLVICSFFIGLIISFIGVLPFEKKVDILSPSEIRDYQERALRHKLRYLWASSISLVVGFAIIIAELIVKTFE